MNGYTLIERSPTVEEYQRLCEAVGWESVDDKAMESGLRNSLFSVCVIYKDEVIGLMAATIGLMAATGASKFYERYGFKERPLDSPGMFRVWEK